MNKKLSFTKSTFANVYEQALKSQLQAIGSNLKDLRMTRKESLETVAYAVNLQPDTLQCLENGETDFRLKVLFNLCDYYCTSLEKVVTDSGMMLLKIA